MVAQRTKIRGYPTPAVNSVESVACIDVFKAQVDYRVRGAHEGWLLSEGSPPW
jgi:hypothetical protein